jgi:hypothetical protein
VSGSFCVCSFEKLKIASMNFDVVLGSLSIVQNSFYEENKVIVQTPHGTHCVAGATVNTADTACPTQTTRDAGITATTIDTSSYCQSSLYVCSDTSAACPASGAAISAGQGDFTIQLDDGPVQFLIDGSTTTASITYAPTLDTFAVSSQFQIGVNKVDFESSPDDTRIYLYEVVSPGYAKMWAHSSLKQYIQVRPWLLSILSLSLLKPVYERYPLIHIPSGTCPYLVSSSLTSNTLISEKIKELSYTEGGHLIAQKEGGDYYEYWITSENTYASRKIPFLDNNVIILVCLSITLFIGIFSIGVVSISSIRLKRIGDIFYSEYLVKTRKFSQTKKLNQNDAKIIQSEPKTKSNGKNTRSILRVGICSSKTVKDNNKNTNTIGTQREIKSNIQRLSIFKIIGLSIDYYKRRNTNSLKSFLSSIYVDKGHFTLLKEDSEEYVGQTSIRLDLFVPKYLVFCTKNGLTATNIRKNEKVLKRFKVKLEYRESNQTVAYTNMRWKTNFEIIEHSEKKKNAKDGKKIDKKEKNNIKNFVNLYLLKCSFDTDFVLATDLLERYDRY